MKLKSFFNLFALSFFILISNSYSQENLETDLDDYVPKVLKEFKVPGIAVGVIKDGKLLFAKGYGVKDIITNDPVNANTLFQIASNSKAFTSACLAILVDQGKLSWDDRVIDKLPGFKMSDPYVTNEMRVRDLLCHRSGLGLGAGDLMYWPPSDFTRGQILYKLRYVPLSTSFRSIYAYDNILYPVAGELIQAVSGMSWEEFVQENIFDQLGMSHSLTGVKQLMKTDDYATPYTLVDGKLTTVKMCDWDNVAPAGGIITSVNDISKWVITQLDSGRINNSDKRLFDKKETVQMWMPHINIPLKTQPPGLQALKANFAAYGLGWRISEYQGEKLVSHAGAFPGFFTQVTMVPDNMIGVIVFTNQEVSAVLNTVTYFILDELLFEKDTNWMNEYSELVKKSKNKVDKEIAKMDSLRNKDSKPSLSLAKYAGTYGDKWYGTVSVEYNNGKLYMQFDHTPDLNGELKHWQYDTFVAEWKDRTLHGDAFVTFSLSSDGSVANIKMEKFRPDTDFSFDFQDLDLEPVKD